MIWLSPNSGTLQGSIYFDMRDIEFRRTGSNIEGVVQGLLGDGQRELWGEVKIGADPQVNILPLWTEEGLVESFSDHIDEADLKQQLLDAINAAFASFGSMSAPDQLHSGLFGRAFVDGSSAGARV